MQMKYFRNPETGDVSAFEWPKDESWVSPGLVAMTDEEVFCHVNPPVKMPTRADIEKDRLIAYADPILGSDRYFAEANAEEGAGNAEKAGELRAVGSARRDEIQEANPWPEVG